MIASKFDSCLELTTEDVMSHPPKVFQRLVEGSIFGTSSFATGNSRLSYPAVKLRVPEGVVVDKVLVRSALQYKLLNTSYIAEVAIYNGWNSNDTRQVPVTSCGVSLYHKDWDLLMTPDEGGEGTRVLDMGSLFPDASGAEEGLSNFLAHNQTLQRFISHVTIDASVCMGSGLPTS